MVEDELQACIALVEQVQKDDSGSGGLAGGVNFCRDEAMDAQMLLKEISADRGKLSSAFDLCKAKAAKGDDAFKGGPHSTDLIRFSSSLLDSLSVFDEGEGGRIPISPATGAMVVLLRNYSSAFDKWRAEQWDLCAQVARDIRTTMDIFAVAAEKEGGTSLIIVRDCLRP